MKYFVIADVHSFYYEMMQALEAAGFDPHNKDHTLVSLGDVTDRGIWPNEVIEYLLSLERKILIRGNHEDLLEELLTYKRSPSNMDVHNGTFRTIKYLAEAGSQTNISDDTAIDFWHNTVLQARKSRVLEYLNSCVNYFETNKYVFVHGWVPTRFNIDIGITEVIENREKVHPFEWGDSRWASGIQMTKEGMFVDNKTIVCGHWHAAAWHTYFDGAQPMSNHTAYFGDKVIALDACTVRSGFVNCAVLEDE